MKRWPNKALLGAGTALLLMAIPALSQEAPESLLPPGFGDPQDLPPPEDRPRAPRPQQPQPAPGPTANSPTLQESGNPEEGEGGLGALEQPRPLNYFSIPEGRARPVDLVGPLEPGNFGLGRDAFGRGDGAMLAALMRQLDAPLPSRWASILLRRALLSRLDAPAGINPVDWVAERADLLLRMGEADAARMLVQSVDQENYTPRMLEVAGQTALATADPAALCPIVGPARTISDDGVWLLAEAMCAALEGEPARASALADQARRQSGAGGIDLALAEKVIGSGAETRRASIIDWQGVNELTPWRLGLASATGAEIPPALVNRATPRMQAWLARAPMLPLEQRLGAASVAATLGVFSSHTLVEIYSLLLDQTDPAELEGTIGQRLRLAWTHRDPAERVEAMRELWEDPAARAQRYARLILTSGAAARVPASPDFAGDADNLVASLLSAGLDRQAAHWGQVVQDSDSQRAWAMLAVAAPGSAVEISPDRVQALIGDGAGGRRAQLLVAALAGLGRAPDADAARLAAATGLQLGGDDAWTAAIDRAAQRRLPGVVALLSGIGMQTGRWSGVPPHYLFRMMRALRTVGLDYEARMIAAEAIARL